METPITLLQEYKNIIEQCKQMKVEIEADFWRYKAKVNLEWTQLVAERDEIEMKWKTRDKNALIGIYDNVNFFLTRRNKGKTEMIHLIYQSITQQ